MAGFDSFMNTAVPIVVIVFFLFIMGRALRKPLGELFNWIRGMFDSKKEVVTTNAISYE